MIWTNEEGSLYPPAMMVSGIICYDYLPDYLKPNFEYDNMMAMKNVKRIIVRISDGRGNQLFE